MPPVSTSTNHHKTQPRERIAVPVAGFIGVLAVLAALAVGHFVAALIAPNASPYLAVGNGAIDLTPGTLKEFAVRNFGTADKTVLLSGMAVVILVLAVVAGILSRRSARPGLVITAAFGLVGIAAVVVRPDIRPLGVLAPIASLVACVGVFRWLHGMASGNPAAATGPRGMGRRRFLVSSAGVAAGAGVFGAGGQLLSNGTSVESDRTQIGMLTPKFSAPPIPAGASFESDGTPPFLTSNQRFYRVDTALTVPQVRLSDWSLRIHGMVNNEKTFTFDDLRRRDLVERTITLTCVSNEVGGPYVSTTNFIGVDLRELLLEAGVKPGADELLSTSADGYTAGTPVAALLDPHRGAMVAIGMNRLPLPAEHGFPARMVVPGIYGYASATKWVTSMELTTFAAKQGYWVPRGYAVKAPIKTESRIDTPKAFQTVRAGRVTISGIAYAQPKGVDKVEVRMNAGPWRTAQLATEVNPSTWRMWRCEFTLKSGSYTVESRATDRSGYTQTSAQVSPLPDGATGWPSIVFTVS
jgi:DMSO/TMAO reductase YedYZ molybdopterin-dependent catalytic subunit